MGDIEETFDDLSMERRKLYEKFRFEVEDLIQPWFDDHFIWKWLKATNYDIEKARNRLQEHLKFRKRYGLDTILKDFTLPEVVQKHYCYEVIGFDKKGNIVVLNLTAFTDFKGLVRSLSYSQQIKSFCYVLESLQQKMKDENEKTGTNGRKIIIVIDMKNLPIKQILDSTVRKRAIEIGLIFESNYPEFLQHLYFINAPIFFHAWYNFVKKFLDPIIVNKFQVFSSGGWMECLLRTIDPSIIPAFIGGSRTDPDGNPDCNSLFTRNPDVPVSMYLSNSVKIKDDPSSTKVTIRERVYYNHSVIVRHRKSVLSWSFETVGYDIGFALYYVPTGVKPMRTTSTPVVSKSFRHRVRRNSKEGHVLVVPLDRVESQHYPEIGSIVCENSGTYLLHFDNTYSWMRPKTLYYKVEVAPPTLEDSNAVSNGGFSGDSRELTDIEL